MLQSIDEQNISLKNMKKLVLSKNVFSRFIYMLFQIALKILINFSIYKNSFSAMCPIKHGFEYLFYKSGSLTSQFYMFKKSE